MTGSQLFRYQCIDEKGVIPGALAHFRQGRAPGVVFTDKAMRIPGRNPMPANGRGVLVAYLPAGEEFEVTITRPDGSHFEQFDSTAFVGGVEHTIEQPEPEVIIKEVPVEVEKIVEVEKVVYRDHPATKMLSELEATKAKIDDRPPAHEEPPASIADLFDPELTARQNQEALQKKYADAMSMREIHLANDEDSKAMELLKKAERYDSGINWNRARLAEVI